MPFLPTKQPMVDQNGSITPVWQQYFQALQTQLSTVQTQATASAATLAGFDSTAGQTRRVRVASTAALTISTGVIPGAEIDGVTLVAGDFVLLKDQPTAAENGIYVCSATPARNSNYATFNAYPGALVAVEEGTTNADTVWLCTADLGGTLGVTAITWAAH